MVENPELSDTVGVNILGKVIDIGFDEVKVNFENGMTGWVKLDDIVEVIPNYSVGDEIDTSQPEPPVGTELKFLGSSGIPIYRVRTSAGWVRIGQNDSDPWKWSELRKDVKWRITHIPGSVNK